jgi:DNA-directed RNA polymerase specialized sigma24 family protein
MDRDAAADALGVERGHLRVLLHRGRHKLRAALEQSGITAVPASAR